MNGLDLFSGIGGISLALKPWVRTIAYCEIDRYCQGVLLSRMQSGDIDRAPICEDVRSLKGEMLPEIDIITAGFPCQDISVAGRGEGLAGERSGLFYEIIRLVKEIKPSFLFLENVPAIRTRGLSEVTNALTKVGYDCRWTCLTAASVGAPHRRERWFLLAHSTGKGLEGHGQNIGACKTTRQTTQSSINPSNGEAVWGRDYRELLRMDDGLPYRAHRIKSLGNAVVPVQAQAAFERLLKCVG